ncbi:hypothetical protein EJ08DRAFT_661007 [Tothia fuscella]|uniref:Uncharacterized protein n=1 Tax=Tothia fuscella TaxID=1048955 RepID=A0A9P4TY72_9PEZI|nr:hypothetical protein EJ08DRAFT_661007 [Tothia fuscella]
MKIAFSKAEEEIIRRYTPRWKEGDSTMTAGDLLRHLCQGTDLLQDEGDVDLESKNNALWLKYGRDLHLWLIDHNRRSANSRLKDPYLSTCLTLEQWEICKAFIEEEADQGRFHHANDILSNLQLHDPALNREIGPWFCPKSASRWIIYS